MRLSSTLRWFPILLAASCAMSNAGGKSAPTLDIIRASNEGLRRIVLDNGMICLLKEDHSAPVLAIQIWVGTGSMHEEQYLGAGLSHYMEHMIFKGTPTRGPADISKQIDDAGGEINAYTAQDRTVFYADLPSKNWRVGVDVLSDAVMNAALPEEEWEREKEVILREFAMGKDDPGRELNKLLWSTAYREHPYRVPIIGYEDVFRTMTRDNLSSFFHRHYTPDNMITVLVGDIDADEVEAYLRTAFAGFKRRARAPVTLPVEPPQMAPRFARQTGPYQVSRLQWAYHTVPLSHPDAAALDVLAGIVGQGRSSRLSRTIKEQLRLVHDIDAWSFTPKDPGLFGISAVFDPTNETAVIAAIQEEVDSWSAKPFTAAEIEKAKRMTLVNELDGLQTMSGQAGGYASGEYYAGNPRFVEVYLANLEHVTPESLRDVVRRYLRPENRTIAILSPEQPIVADRGRPGAENGINLSRDVLTNGVRLLVREDHRLPFVYICAALGGGLLTEQEENNGITQLMSELLTRGTATRSADEIAEALESRGASLGTFAGRNSFGLQAQCLTDDVDDTMAIFADCLLASTFPEEEIEKQRAVQIANVRQQREQPMFLAQESLRELLFPRHPYRFNPMGNETSLARISRDDLVAHYRKYVTTSNLVLAIFGEITREKARSLAESLFGGLDRHDAPSLAAAPPKPDLPARTKRREPKEQAIVLIGFPGIDIKDPRMDALSVLQKACSGLSSDLGIEVREKRGLVYFVGAFNIAGLEPGLFAFYAGTRDEAVDEVERLINEQIERISKEGVRDEEWLRAREQILAAHDMSLQNNAELAQVCALNELCGLGYRYSLQLTDRMNALTLDKIRDAAASLFQPERRAVSLLLPEKAEEENKGSGHDESE